MNKILVKSGDSKKWNIISTFNLTGDKRFLNVWESKNDDIMSR